MWITLTKRVEQGPDHLLKSRFMEPRELECGALFYAVGKLIT